jgi:hypothetical protein
LWVIEVGGATSFFFYFQVQIVLSELIMGCFLDGDLGLELPTTNPL